VHQSLYKGHKDSRNCLMKFQAASAVV